MPFDLGKSAKRFAGAALNQLPDRMNLFMRYMTGVGNEGLQLDPSTLSSIRRATEEAPKTVTRVPIGEMANDVFGASDNWIREIEKSLDKAKADGFDQTPLMQESKKMLEQAKLARAGDLGMLLGRDVSPGETVERTTLQYGPGLPTSGAKDPYGSGDKAVTQTLGRFNAQVGPDGSVRVTDTYDMANEYEDPDLISGKFQPGKALLEVQSIWDPQARARLQQGMRPPIDQRNYGTRIKQAGTSDTRSPATALARAAMYLAPIKPQSYEIDVTIPSPAR